MMNMMGMMDMSNKSYHACMEERHANEQYFFDEATLNHLASFASTFNTPAHLCCICAPMLGKQLSASTSHQVSILDIDERFADLAGFVRFDLKQPEWLGIDFDLIICDPPFFNLSMEALFRALRILAKHDYTQPIMISYLSRRSKSILKTFARFNLKPTGYFPEYQTVQKVERNRIEFFSNLDEAQLAKLMR